MKVTNVFSTNLETKYVNDELWLKIEKLNLNLIQDRMLIKHGWTEERTAEALKGYRQYLYITQMLNKPLSPTKDIDDIWHEHILHTNKYAIDCQNLFGNFLHHFPTPAKWNSKADISFISADCKVTGCEGKCSNDSCDSGTTNDGYIVKGEAKINFDAPVLEEHKEPVHFYNIQNKFFR